MLLFFFIFIKLILPKAEVYKIDYNYKKYNQDKDMPWKSDIRDVYCYFEIFLNVWQIVQQCRQDTCAFKMPANQSPSVEYLNIINAICPFPPLLPYCKAIKGDAVQCLPSPPASPVSPIKLLYIMQLRAGPVLAAWLGDKNSQFSSWCNFCVSSQGIITLPVAPGSPIFTSLKPSGEIQLDRLDPIGI